jgi:exopolyphosphatase/guanosine-5'-triphosphate,3'-diphosphate pyrophosphatase
LRLGCIDIGSNTTRLLVAECDGGRLRGLYQERAFTRLGYELHDRGTIGAAKIGEVVRVVAGQLAGARAHGATEVRVVGTAAIRKAVNGRELVTRIRAATGMTVEILSEQEEARLAFVGVVGTLEHAPAGELGVVDVGGGSSELVVGDVAGGVGWWASVPLGSGMLAYAHLASDPPSAQELRRAEREIDSVLSGLNAPRPAAAVAVGGSATSLALLAGAMLDSATLDRALALMVAHDSCEVARRYGIDAQRARLLPAGLLILRRVTELFGTALSVGRGGIREGVLLEAGAR